MAGELWLGLIPALPDWELSHVIGDPTPRERKALAQICETADVLTVDETPWLLVPADPRLLDTLADWLGTDQYPEK